MLDFEKLIDLAVKLDVPGLVEKGVEFAKELKAAADRTPHILNEADKAELDQIHADALAANASLDAKLAAAEKR